MLTTRRELLAGTVSHVLLILGTKGPPSTNSGLFHRINTASLHHEPPPNPWPRISTEKRTMDDETDPA